MMNELCVYRIYTFLLSTHSFLQVVVLTFIYLVVWLGLSVVLSMVMTVYVQLKLGCDKYDDRKVQGTCTTLYEPSKYRLNRGCDIGAININLSVFLSFSNTHII